MWQAIFESIAQEDAARRARFDGFLKQLRNGTLPNDIDVTIESSHISFWVKGEEIAADSFTYPIGGFKIARCDAGYTVAIPKANGSHVYLAFVTEAVPEALLEGLQDIDPSGQWQADAYGIRTGESSRTGLTIRQVIDQVRKFVARTK